jgi:hypothetical protein
VSQQCFIRYFLKCLAVAIVAAPTTYVLAAPRKSPSKRIVHRWQPREVRTLLSGNLTTKLSAIRLLISSRLVEHRLLVIRYLCEQRTPDVKWILMEFLKRDPSAIVRSVCARLLGPQLVSKDLGHIDALLSTEKDPNVRKEFLLWRKQLVTGCPFQAPSSRTKNSKGTTGRKGTGVPDTCVRKKVRKPSQTRKRASRNWRLRIGVPFMVGFNFIAREASGPAFGAEFVLQLELFSHHLIQFVGLYGVGRKVDDVDHPRAGMFGMGAGYAYEWVWARGDVRFELGATAGLYAMGRDGVEFGFVMFRPTLHVALKTQYVWFSTGPRVAVGIFVWGGFVAGFTFRL